MYGKFLSPFIDRMDPPVVSIFTTNYDRVIESLWWSTSPRDVFSRNVRLARGFVQRLDNRPSLVFDSADYQKPSDSTEAIVRLFKLHGSLNWRQQGTQIIETDADEYSNRSALVYPLRKTKAFLEEPFKRLFQFWEQEIEAASDCVVIGASLRDPHIVSPIVQACKQNPQLKLWIVVQKPEAVLINLPPEIHSRFAMIHAYFGDDRLGPELARIIFDPGLRQNTSTHVLDDPPNPN